MKQIISFFINNIYRTGIFFLFVIAIVFIVLILPKETRYRFEYQKGKPWLHETLISSFVIVIAPLVGLTVEINNVFLGTLMAPVTVPFSLFIML